MSRAEMWNSDSISIQTVLELVKPLKDISAVKVYGASTRGLETLSNRLGISLEKGKDNILKDMHKD